MRRTRARLLASAAISLSVLLTCASPVNADDFGGASADVGPMNIGSPTDNVLIDTGYDLGSVDMTTGTLLNQDLTTSMTDSYAAAVDTQNTDLMIIDSAQAAQAAQAAAEAQRMAAERKRQAEAQASRGAGVLDAQAVVPKKFVEPLSNIIVNVCPVLPPDVVAAQIQQSSGWDAGATGGFTGWSDARWSSQGRDGDGDGLADPKNETDAMVSLVAADCDAWNGTEGIKGDHVTLMLAAYATSVQEVRDANGIPNSSEARKYVSDVTSTATAVVSGQVTVGPNGCPTSVPSNTLRNGASQYDVFELCSDSVAGASSDIAAAAIKWAFKMLGSDYACDGVGRLDSYRADCSSLMARSYHEGAGLSSVSISESTRDYLPWDGHSLAKWLVKVPTGERMPGDLLTSVSCPTWDCGYQHVSMMVAHGYKLHTNSCGDVAHITTYNAGDIYSVDRAKPNAT